MSENYRIDHYYSLESKSAAEEGHIFCDPAEGNAIAAMLRAALPKSVTVIVEPGGEYDYTTEDGTTADQIAADILTTWR